MSPFGGASGGLTWKLADIGPDKKMNEYRPAGMLDKNISLFDGKVGCGTCHNIYSQIRNLLVLDNARSKLCLECHLK
jgi:predicted CXXCH cytochrome family protein